MITLILRSIIIYCIVLVAIRLMGKRQIGDMQPFELVATLIIADLACIPMSDVSIPIVFGIVPLLSLIIIHYFFTFLNRKSVYFRTFLNGKPVIIIDENGIDYKALKKLNMTLNDLNEGLRACNCFNIADVAYAIVETNGNISVLLKSLASPATNEDLKISKEENSLNVILVNDGKIMKENLICLNLTEKFINKILKEQKTKSISDILIFSINQNGEIYYQEKNKPCKSIFKKEKI
ncbi:MAG: DUF421 domain-containing protein [Clostridia bacterium]|nr:DUF421 domain-containing protein [Clostridia bacterium]